MGTGFLLLAVFVLLESRNSAPLVKLSIFRIRSISTANSVMLLVASALFGFFFFASLYVQDILGYSPLKAGLAFLPASLGIIVGAGIAQTVIKRVGVRNLTVIGIALATVGMVILTQLPIHGRYFSNLFIGLVPLAIGMGLTFVPITLLATSGVENDDAGLASGLFNSAQQIGGSLGLAIFSTLAAEHTSSIIRSAGHPLGVSAQFAARLAGYHLAFAAAAIALGAGATLLVLLLRPWHVKSLSYDSPLPVGA
jgi:predicted MFS family arabinose efflux permease